MPRPILIIGAGIAGLWTALKLAPQPVILLTGAPLGKGAATGWAQGGVAVAAGPGDSADAHRQDTLAAGAGLTRPEAARALASGISGEIKALRALGVPFEEDADGQLAMGLEAAHSFPRIAHIKGDQAGALILETLIREVRAAPHITLREGWHATALLPATDGGCAGGRDPHTRGRPPDHHCPSDRAGNRRLWRPVRRYDQPARGPGTGHGHGGAPRR